MKLLEYEAKLNRDLFPKYPCFAICQYDRWKFDPEIIKGVIMTHPLLVRGNNIYHNFYYIPPEEYLNQKRAEMEVQYCLNNLERERQIQEALARLGNRQDNQTGLLGSLERIARDMEEVEEEMKHGRDADKIKRAQQRILNRLLTAQKSLYKQGYSKKRKAERVNKEYAPLGVPELGDEYTRYRETILSLRRSGASACPSEYQPMVEDYYEALSKESE